MPKPSPQHNPEKWWNMWDFKISQVTTKGPSWDYRSRRTGPQTSNTRSHNKLLNSMKHASPATRRRDTQGQELTSAVAVQFKARRNRWAVQSRTIKVGHAEGGTWKEDKVYLVYLSNKRNQFNSLQWRRSLWSVGSSHEMIDLREEANLTKRSRMNMVTIYIQPYTQTSCSTVTVVGNDYDWFVRGWITIHIYNS